MDTLRISGADLDALIDCADYHQVEGTTMTICMLHLKSGFIVTGESATLDPDHFDAEVGKQEAFKQAREKLWALEGYRLTCERAGAEYGV